MKKFVCVVLALAIVATIAVPLLAAEDSILVVLVDHPRAFEEVVLEHFKLGEVVSDLKRDAFKVRKRSSE